MQTSRKRRGWHWASVTDEVTGEKKTDLAAGLVFTALAAVAAVTATVFVIKLLS